MPAIELDSEQLNAVVQKAILDSITPEQREEMVGKAIKFLMTPKDSPYSNSRHEQISPLDEAFRTASFDVARNTIIEELKKPGGLQDKIAEAVKDALHEAFGEHTENRSEMITNMAHSITAAFKVKDRW